MMQEVNDIVGPDPCLCEDDEHFDIYFVSKMLTAKLVLSAHALLGEGPLWLPEEERLYWLDIEGRKLHRFDPVTDRDETFGLPNKVGCVVPCQSDRFLMAAQHGIEEFRIDGDRIVPIAVKAHPEADKPGNRYNDGKCSPEGRLWFGSLNMEHRTGAAALYVLDGTDCRTALTGATNSNGLGWSPDGRTFYWIDTPTRRIEAFDYEPEQGTLSNRRTVVIFPQDEADRTEWGRPDGMTVDAEGMIWVAHWLGSRVTRWNPIDGKMLEEIRLPVSRVTSATFGGSDLATLFITTASKDMMPEEKVRQPDAGGLFAVKPGVTGLPPARYKN